MWPADRHPEELRLARVADLLVGVDPDDGARVLHHDVVVAVIVFAKVNQPN